MLVETWEIMKCIMVKFFLYSEYQKTYFIQKGRWYNINVLTLCVKTFEWFLTLLLLYLKNNRKYKWNMEMRDRIVVTVFTVMILRGICFFIWTIKTLGFWMLRRKFVDNFQNWSVWCHKISYSMFCHFSFIQFFTAPPWTTSPGKGNQITYLARNNLNLFRKLIIIF